MYTKITHGTNFMGAALYDAEGLSPAQKKQKAGQVELIETNNLLQTDPRGIAREMQAMASYSRSHKPVWNLSMSAPEGVQLTTEQWQQAAAHNLRVLGVEPDRYQYAIYRHSDTKHDHIHILLNAVPIDGGPALSRQFKAAKAKLASPQLDQALGIKPTKGASIQDEIGEALTKAMGERPTTADELQTDLLKHGVLIDYATNKTGIYGVTFKLAEKDHKPVKGSSIEILGKKAKWNTLAAFLEANRAEYQAEIEQLREDKARADEARRRAEQERDQARNQPARVEIQEKEVIKEVVKPDPQDKALIERLRQENEAANAALRREENARKQAEIDRAKAEANAEKNREIAHQNYQIAQKIHQENVALKQQLQAKPSREQVLDRVNRFYMLIGKGSFSIDSANIERYMRRAKESDSVGIISNFLAQDFSAPSVAAEAIERKLQSDTSRQDYWPLNFVDKWNKMPKNEQNLGFKTTENSEAWRNVCNSQTLTPTQQDLVKSLQKMRFGTGGGEKEDKKRQVKY